MSNTYIILNVNENLELADQAKLDSVQNLQSHQKLIIIGEEANRFNNDHNLDAIVYNGEPAEGLCQAYETHIQEDDDPKIIFRLIAAEYPVLRLLVEKTFDATHVAEYETVASGVRGVFYQDMMSVQKDLMIKYINVLEHIDTPNMESVLEAVRKPYTVAS